jgi:hypothetical protein
MHPIFRRTTSQFISPKFISSFATALLPYLLLSPRLAYSIKGVEGVPLTLKTNVAISLLRTVAISLLIHHQLVHGVNHVRACGCKEVDSGRWIPFYR